MIPEQLAVRLMRSKAGDLEARCLTTAGKGWSELDRLRADIALLYGLVANHLEAHLGVPDSPDFEE